jgi:hypothetical protein
MYTGVIIEESLEDKTLLQEVRILQTKVEEVTAKHATAWLSQWTLHTVTIPDEKAVYIAERLSKSLNREHGGSWYADFKNDTTHYIIFRNKVFSIDRSKPQQYEMAAAYGKSLGIPEHQLDWV